MEIEFIKANWHLFAALVAILVLLMVEPIRRRAGGVQSLTTLGLTQLIGRETTKIIDVSEKKEFDRAHLPDAKNIAVGELADKLKSIEKFKDKPVVVTCNTGMRSQKGAAILKKNGFTNVSVLTGGVQAWLKDSLPIERSK